MARSPHHLELFLRQAPIFKPGVKRSLLFRPFFCKKVLRWVGFSLARDPPVFYSR